MIYCQLRSRAHVDVSAPLLLGSVATLLAPDGAQSIPIPCPQYAGVWRIDALACTQALRRQFPQEEVTLLGAPVCYVHRVHLHRRDFSRPLRTLAACLLLFAGSALGMAWFHSDVDMPQAQLQVYRAVTGQDVPDSRLITIPYCIGVALGVGVFYALPSRKATTPLEVKLAAYLSGMEETEGKDPPHAS